MNKIRELSEEKIGDSLLATANELLNRENIFKSDLDGILINRGPTSFTALRIGMSVAKALSLSLDIPLFGISSLRALAVLAPPDLFKVTVLKDAYKKKLYVSDFDLVNGLPESSGSVKCLAFDELPQAAERKNLVFSDTKHPEKFMEYLGEENLLFLGSPPQTIAYGMLKYFLSLEKAEIPNIPISPFYISEPEAVINHKAKHGS